MQPVSCWKFIQIKALLTIALTNEWMAANEVYSRCFWQCLYSTALCSQYFMAVYWEDREHIAITWCSCTKSLLKHSHNQNKVLELSEFQPVPLFWPEFWSFSAFHHFLYSPPVHLRRETKHLFSLLLYNTAVPTNWYIPVKRTVAVGMIPACNYCPGIVFIYLFLCDLDKCGLLNMAKMNEPIISGQDTRQADCFDLQGYVNKYQWRVLFFRLLYVSLASGLLSTQGCEFSCSCWVMGGEVLEGWKENTVREQLPGPCRRCYFCHMM